MFLRSWMNQSHSSAIPDANILQQSYCLLLILGLNTALDTGRWQWSWTRWPCCILQTFVSRLLKCEYFYNLRHYFHGKYHTFFSIFKTDDCSSKCKYSPNSICKNHIRAVQHDVNKWTLYRISFMTIWRSHMLRGDMN